MNAASIVLLCVALLHANGESTEEMFTDATDVSATNSSTTIIIPRMAEIAQRDIVTEMFQTEFLRYPVAVAIDLSSLEEAKDLFGEYNRMKFPDENVVLVPFAETGPRSPIRCNNSWEFFRAVDRLTAEGEPDSDSPTIAAVLGLLMDIPFDSAVLVLTGRRPSDEKLGEVLTQTLIRKRCRMYVIWTGEQDVRDDELMLEEISKHSGGRLGYVADEIAHAKLANRNKILVSSLEGISGPSEIEIPVDSAISSLQIKINGKLSTATLVDPEGSEVDLLKKNPPTKSMLDVEISTLEMTPGMWLLKTDQTNTAEPYDVSVSGINKSELLISRTHGKRSYDEDESPEEFEIPESAALMGQLRFPEDKEIEETTQKKHVGQDSMQSKNGTKLTATAVAQQKTVTQASVPIIVEVASGSSLEARPGSFVQISFDVKNNLALPVALTFFARSDNVIINSIQPPQAYLMASASTRVQVSITSPPNLQSGGISVITFTVQGAGRVTSRSAMVYFTTTSITDTWDPKIDYKYQGDCRNYDEPNTCENGQWGFEATVRDEDSGLLRVMSEPFGLIFRSEFVAGTRSPVTVTYTASCCQPKVDIWAEDLRGNSVRRGLDVFHQGLLAGEIAAIVVGVVLLIILIIVIILVVVLIRKRNRNKIELPRHRAGSR